MINTKPKLPIFHLTGETLTFILVACIAYFFINEEKHLKILSVALIGTLLVKLLVNYWIGLYNANSHDRLRQRIMPFIKVYLLLIFLALLFYPLISSSLTTKHLVAAFILGFPVFVSPINLLITNKLDKLKSSSEYTKFTLVAGIGGLAESVEKHLYSHHKSGHQIKGFINCKKEVCKVGQDRVVGDLEHINEYLSQNAVDEIVIALPTKVSKKVKSIIAAADYHGVRVKYIPDYSSLLGTNYKMTRYGQIDAVNVRQLPLDETSSFMLKNSFDKVFAALALIVLLPLLILIAILIKLNSPGPIFYNPVRIGKRGRPFKVYKFRSMCENDTFSGGVLSTKKDDPRVTKLGKILRKYSLDELPQFWNVILGDMSVVGPRPHRSYLNQQLQVSVDKYMIRHYFKPGITGWAQVNGWRGPTETEEQRMQRTLHDLWYMENWSFFFDLKIIYMTVFSRKAHKTAF